ncbi:MAG: hypothetical protein ACR2PA_10470 [Hyphomicrobiaceae bacterium]
MSEIIAETASNRERQQLSAIETEAKSTSSPFWSIDYDSVGAGPTESRFRAFDIAQFNGDF